MTTEIFNHLPDPEKNSLIFEAEKVDEVADDYFNYILLKIEDLFC
jgi:hypothetical protein